MGVIWTSRTRTSQPQGAASINMAHPRASSVSVAFSGSRDIYGAIPYYESSGVTFGSTNAIGYGVALNGGANTEKRWRLKTPFAMDDPITLVVYGVFSSLPSLCSSVFVSNWGDFYSNPSGGGLSLLAYGGGTPPDFHGWGVNRDLATGVAWALNVPQHVVITKAAGATATVSVYRNGTLLGSTSLAMATGVMQNYFTIGGKHVSGTASFTGVVNNALLLRCEMSASEVQALYQNPWQLFAPERRPIFFNTAGGGSTVTGAGSSAGVGAASGVGASTSAQVGSSAGVGSASGVGASTANSVGSSTGIGTASSVGSSTGGSDGVGTSTGTGTATGVGASTAASLGSTAGVGAASGIGAATAASVGSTSGTGTASGVGTNGSIVSTGVGSASGTGTATGISPIVSRGGGKTTGSNLSRKQKKKLKAVESQEWLKAEETARQLLSDRFTKQTPQEKAQALETYIESLQPVIEALKALTTQIEEVVEEAPVIELTPHQEVIQRFDRLEKKVKSVEELIIILMADL